MYAMLISLLDGVGLIIPLSLVMTSAFGINGLWWAFPVSGVFLLAFTLIGNHVIAKKHPDRETEKDIRENMLILKKMSRVIDNSYIMGMNNVRIVLDRNR